MNRLVASQMIMTRKTLALMDDTFYFSHDGALVFVILLEKETQQLFKALVFDAKDLSQHK